MAIKLYNTLTRKKEIFKPLKKGFVGLYTCGPTVYDYAHIGNFRTYIFQDFLKAVLVHNGYRIRHIMNITDVDDKTIAGAKREGLSLSEFTRRYEHAFKQDLETLHIVPPQKFTRATEHIPQMIRLIGKLLKKGIAYQADSSVYFDISAFKPYGRLSRVSSRSLKTSARMDIDEYAKQDAQDFVLWKAKKEGEPAWSAPFGEGRPGWHIECSAMATAYLKQPFDIHTGGIDLLFPHHENEIAQSEAANGKQFVRYWMHGEHLMVDGQKMSKSLGNMFTLRDIEQREFDLLDFRYLILTAHYRSKLNFTWESLTAARNARKELTNFIHLLLAETARQKKPHPAKSPYERYRVLFFSSVNDDLNIPKALAVVWKFIHAYHGASIRHPHGAFKLLLEYDAILGLRLKDITLPDVPVEIQNLAEKREQLRKEKRWQEADAVRAELEKTGWRVEDTPNGPRVIQT